MAFAAVGGEEAEWQDIVLSDEEFEEILSNNPDNQIPPLSSDLINRHSIAIQKNGNCLIIAGTTYGSSEVSKCGFTKVSIQRRSNSMWRSFRWRRDRLSLSMITVLSYIFLSIFYQKAFLSQVDINIVLLAHTMLRKILFQHKKSMVHLTY